MQLPRNTPNPFDSQEQLRRKQQQAARLKAAQELGAAGPAPADNVPQTNGQSAAPLGGRVNRNNAGLDSIVTGNISADPKRPDTHGNRVYHIPDRPTELPANLTGAERAAAEGKRILPASRVTKDRGPRNVTDRADNATADKAPTGAQLPDSIQSLNDYRFSEAAGWLSDDASATDADRIQTAADFTRTASAITGGDDRSAAETAAALSPRDAKLLADAVPAEKRDLFNAAATNADKAADDDATDNTDLVRYGDTLEVQGADRVKEPPKPKTHTIQKGDLLSDLAAKYDVSVEEIRKANGNIDPTKLSIGKDLVIPTVDEKTKARSVILKRGETLLHLKERHGVKVERLKALNDIDDDENIPAGTRIYLSEATDDDKTPPANTAKNQPADTEADPKPAAPTKQDGSGADPNTNDPSVKEDAPATPATSQGAPEADADTQPTTYVIQRGDNLWRLAKGDEKYWLALLDANPQLPDPSDLSAGDVINLPPKTGPTPQEPPAKEDAPATPPADQGAGQAPDAAPDSDQPDDGEVGATTEDRPDWMDPALTFDLGGLKDKLRKHESEEAEAYKDTKGFWTIGIGHKIVWNGKDDNFRAVTGMNPSDYVDPNTGKVLRALTPEQMEQLFELDIKNKVGPLVENIEELRGLDPRAQEIVAEMAYQMGVKGAAGFELMRGALAETPPNYTEAAKQIIESQMAGETPNRAKDYADRMRALAK